MQGIEVNCDFDITGDIPMEKVHYCERFIEMMVDLEALLPTRRFFNLLLDDSHLVVHSRLSALAKREEGKLFGEVGKNMLIGGCINLV